MSHAFCRHCDSHVVTRRPSGLWWLGLIGVAIGMVLAVIASSLIGPFIMFAVPFMALFGFALGPLTWLVTMPATCTGCGREVRYRHPDEVPAALRRPRKIATPHEAPMRHAA